MAQKAFPSSFLADKRICVGTWAWGADPSGSNCGPLNIWNSTGGIDLESNRAAFVSAVKDYSVSFFDTAAVYNNGNSERFIGKCLHESLNVDIASKFAPVPWTFFQSSLVNSCRASLERMGNLQQMSLFQVHSPAYSLRSVETWARGLAEVHALGLAKEVGVSNYNTDQVLRTIKEIEKVGKGLNPGELGYPRLSSNQIEFSLLHQYPLSSGLIGKCLENGVEILAYSTLAQGRLTKRTLTEGKEAYEKRFVNRYFGTCEWEKLEIILKEVEIVGKEKNLEIHEVALAWVRAKGCIPIVGCKDVKQVEMNLKNWGKKMDLTKQQVERLDKVALEGEVSMWHGSSK